MICEYSRQHVKVVRQNETKRACVWLWPPKKRSLFIIVMSGFIFFIRCTRHVFFFTGNGLCFASRRDRLLYTYIMLYMAYCVTRTSTIIKYAYIIMCTQNCIIRAHVLLEIQNSHTYYYNIGTGASRVEPLIYLLLSLFDRRRRLFYTISRTRCARRLRSALTRNGAFLYIPYTTR